MPTLRYARAFDELHRVVLLVNARPEVEFLSQIEDGEPPEGWRETWPEIKTVEEIRRQE